MIIKLDTAEHQTGFAFASLGFVEANGIDDVVFDSFYNIGTSLKNNLSRAVNCE
jgi:hypothetical protein